MNKFESNHDANDSLRLGERLQLAEAAGGIGSFEFDPASRQWSWSPQVAALFGTDQHAAPANFEESLRSVFVDDAPKIRAALEAAKESGTFYVEFRVRHADGRMRWLAGKGQMAAQMVRGTFYAIDERKQLEAKLLAVNETLEARVGELREEARTLEESHRHSHRRRT
jgi:PAS domain-containing protein